MSDLPTLSDRLESAVCCLARYVARGQRLTIEETLTVLEMMREAAIAAERQEHALETAVLGLQLLRPARQSAPQPGAVIIQFPTRRTSHAPVVA